MFDLLFKKRPNKYNIYYNNVHKELVVFDSNEETHYCLVEKGLLLEQVSERFNFWLNIYKVKQ